MYRNDENQSDTCVDRYGEYVKYFHNKGECFNIVLEEFISYGKNYVGLLEFNIFRCYIYGNMVSRVLDNIRKFSDKHTYENSENVKKIYRGLLSKIKNSKNISYSELDYIMLNNHSGKFLAELCMLMDNSRVDSIEIEKTVTMIRKMNKLLKIITSNMERYDSPRFIGSMTFDEFLHNDKKNTYDFRTILASVLRDCNGDYSVFQHKYDYTPPKKFRFCYKILSDLTDIKNIKKKLNEIFYLSFGQLDNFTQEDGEDFCISWYNEEVLEKFSYENPLINMSLPIVIKALKMLENLNRRFTYTIISNDELLKDCR